MRRYTSIIESVPSHRNPDAKSYCIGLKETAEGNVVLYRDHIKELDRIEALYERRITELTKQNLLTGIKLTAKPHFNNLQEISDNLRQAFGTTNYKPSVAPVEVVEDKVIDMSAFVGTGVLIRGGRTRAIRPIDKITIEGQFYHNGLNFNDCEALMNYRHAWSGGDKCPIPEGFKLRIHYRSSGYAFFAGDEYCNDKKWIYKAKDSDIIAFEILGVADGYKLD